MNDVAKTPAVVPEKKLPIKLGTSRQAIKKLATKYKVVPDFTNKEGYAKGKAALKVLVPLRTSIEKERKVQVEAAVTHQRRVNGEAKDLTTLLVAIEKPIKDAKVAQDESVARVKREAEEAEIARIDTIEEKVGEIQALTQDLLGASLEALQERKAEADSIEITESEYMEFIDAANTVLLQVQVQLNNAVTMAEAQAEQQKDIDAQKEVMAKTERENKLRESVNRIRMAPVDLIGKPVADISAAIKKLELINPVEDFGDLADEADEAVLATIVQLEAMENGAQALAKQQEDIDKREQDQNNLAAAQQKAVDDKAKEDREKKEREEKAVELKARLPEDAKLRIYAEELAGVEAPDVEDAHSIAILRSVSVSLSDIRQHIYDSTQEAA